MLLFQSNHENDAKIELYTIVEAALTQHDLMNKHKLIHAILPHIKTSLQNKNMVTQLKSILMNMKCQNIDNMVHNYFNKNNNITIDPSQMISIFVYSNNHFCNNYTKNNKYNNNYNKHNKNYCIYNNSNNKKLEYRADIIESLSPSVGNSIKPNSVIIKKWRMKNNGIKSLPKHLKVLYCGKKKNKMVKRRVFDVGNNYEIKSEQEFTVFVQIKTPKQYGVYTSDWRLTTSDGKTFGQKLKFDLVLSRDQIVNNTQNNDINNNNNEYKYQKQLQMLYDMGFKCYDNEFLQSLLNTHQGNINKVMSVLSNE